MIRPLAVAALLLSMAGPSLSQVLARSPQDAIDAPIEDIGWSFTPANGERTPHDQLRFERRGQSNSIGGGNLEGLFGEDARAALDNPGGPIAFGFRREAGTLQCTGTVSAGREAAGTCRFDPDDAFVTALESRHIETDNAAELWGLALLDAHIATADDLRTEGFVMERSDDLLEATALAVDAGFARELRASGLPVDTLDDLVSAKAVGVDAEWVRAMGEAGYAPHDIDQAIEMRALDVTPDYAQRMARVIVALDRAASQ